MGIDNRWGRYYLGKLWLLSKVTWNWETLVSLMLCWNASNCKVSVGSTTVWGSASYEEDWGGSLWVKYSCFYCEEDKTTVGWILLLLLCSLRQNIGLVLLASIRSLYSFLRRKCVDNMIMKDCVVKGKKILGHV